MNETVGLIANFMTTITFIFGILIIVKGIWDDIYPIRAVHFLTTPGKDTSKPRYSINLGNQIYFSIFIETKKKDNVRIDSIAPLVYHGLCSSHFLRLIEPNSRIDFSMDYSSFGLATNQLRDDVSDELEFGDFHVKKSNVHVKRILKKVFHTEDSILKNIELCNSSDLENGPITICPIIKCEITSRGIKSRYIIYAILNNGF